MARIRLITCYALLGLILPTDAKAESRATGSGWVLSGSDLPPGFREVIRSEIESQERWGYSSSKKYQKKKKQKSCHCAE